MSAAHHGTHLSGELFARAVAELDLLHRRRRRGSCERLSDAQWAILLELFVAAEAGHPMPTTALALAAGAPKSTLLRMINDLVARGYAIRDRNALDGRVTLVRPTAAARAIVAEVFGGAGKEAA